MLTGIRNAAGNWLGRIVLIVLFGLLIVSFAVWGIGDIFRGYGTTVVAKVGSVEIGTEAFRRQYQDELIRLSQQARRNITAEQARLFGIDRQVLSRMITEALLNEEARRRGLNVSAEDVARWLVAEPVFRGSNGQFSRPLLEEYLRQNGLTEALLVNEQRKETLRRHIGDAIAGGFAAPDALVGALQRYRTEARTIEYLTLPAASVGTIDPPDEAALKAFFEERKAQFRAPEYRVATALAVQPLGFAAEVSVSEDEIRKAYDAEIQAGRIGTPERRRIQQIVFPSEAEARAAVDKLKAGTTFDALAEQLGLPQADIDLGLKRRNELLDPAVAAAAFDLPAGGTSDVVAGQFGPVVLRVSAVEPVTAPPYESVRDSLRPQVIASKVAADPAVRDKVSRLHDEVEDLRASGKGLQALAEDLKLPLVRIDGIDAGGMDRNGRPFEGLPERDALVRAIFASDIGVDNEAMTTRDGGYLWFDVQAIDAARERGFEDVKAEVERRWREEEANRRLTARAAELAKKAADGTSMAKLAEETGLSLEIAAGVTRSGQSPIGPSAQASVFAIAKDGVTTATAANGADRLVLKVTDVVIPAFDPAEAEAKALRGQIDRLAADDLISQYVGRLRSALGATVNERALAQATGAAAQN